MSFHIVLITHLAPTSYLELQWIVICHLNTTSCSHTLNNCRGKKKLSDDHTISSCCRCQRWKKWRILMHWRDTDFKIYSIDWLKWHQLEKQPFGDKSINEFRILLASIFFYRSSIEETTFHTHEIGMVMLDLWWWFKWNNQLIKLPFRYEEEKKEAQIRQACDSNSPHWLNWCLSTERVSQTRRKECRCCLHFVSWEITTATQCNCGLFWIGCLILFMN